jgi:hypothetical protein
VPIFAGAFVRAQMSFRFRSSSASVPHNDMNFGFGTLGVFDLGEHSYGERNVESCQDRSCRCLRALHRCSWCGRDARARSRARMGGGCSGFQGALGLRVRGANLGASAGRGPAGLRRAWMRYPGNCAGSLPRLCGEPCGRILVRRRPRSHAGCGSVHGPARMRAGSAGSNVPSRESALRVADRGVAVAARRPAHRNVQPLTAAEPGRGHLAAGLMPGPAVQTAYMPRSDGCDIGPLTTGACWGAASGAGTRLSKLGICGAGLPKSIVGPRPMPPPECAKPCAPPRPAPRATPSVEPTMQASAKTAAKRDFIAVFLVLLPPLATRSSHPTGGGLIGLASIGLVLSPSRGRAAGDERSAQAPPESGTDQVSSAGTP